jgi:hypothetical protein
MKLEALALARGTRDPGRASLLLREYIQAFTMRSLSESEAFRSLSFIGGTALRFLFDLPRFSEDMDFSLEKPAGYAIEKWASKIGRDLEYAGFAARVTTRLSATVHVVWVRVAELLQEAGIAAQRDQNLSVKIEIDTRPPAGANCRRELVTRHVSFAVQHHDLPSLMTGKTHALITRKWSKGRDWYDLMWYRSHRPPVSPNIVLLQNALNQTEGVGVMDAEAWPQLVAGQLKRLDMREVSADVRPFLERPQDADLLSVENILSVLEPPR